ncbi:MAG: DUF3854 domain-containing protein [Chloroflexota bacterium]|nr:DUF3854 domain-containing protein [Chloroflexota bacterium]
MPNPLVGATPRYRLLATVLTCVAADCLCRQARRRGRGQVHCPCCRTTAPTLELDLRGADIRARCGAGCDERRLQAIADGDDAPLLALYGDGLSAGHAHLLLDSAVTPHVAAARPYATVMTAAGLDRLGFGKRQRNAPALVLGVWNVHGDRATYQARPDTPRVVDGKPLKYETVAGSRMTLDVPRAIREQLRNPKIPLFITEGARKADAAVSAGICCIALLGVWGWRGTNEWGGKTALPDWEMVAFKDATGAGRDVIIAFDSDVMAKPPVFLALTRLKPFLESRGASVRAVYLPAGADGSKVGLDDYLAAGHDIDDLLSLATETLREPGFADGAGSHDEGESQADALVRLGSSARLFADPLGTPFARIPVGTHHECWPLRSKGFRRWLIGAYHVETERAPTGEAVTNALNVLEARALGGGSVEPVFVRIAPDGDAGLFLDLGDADWRAVHVAATGWTVVTDPPVHFLRVSGALPLPVPVPVGSLERLRDFFNVSDEAWPLLKAFLRGCLSPRGPYPVLALNGEQGSAKSTTARMIRALVDPRTPELRAEPHDARDLAIAARGCWLVAYDNVSRVPPWLSNALCRLATGGGFATRELYTDFDEALFDALRPSILTGIADYIVKDDLLDRTVQVTLSTIPESRRKPEKALWAAFEADRPTLLGALLDDVSATLKTLPSVRLDRLPRMADFALWAVAAERGRGEPPQFMRAYADARAASHELAIEASPIGAALLAFITRDLATGPWQGTATQLLARLAELGGDATTRPKEWPRSPRGLSGLLRELAPALRATGVAFTPDLRQGRKRTRLMRLELIDTPPTDEAAAQPSASSAPSAEDVCQGEQPGSGADGRPADADGADGCAAGVSAGVGATPSDDWGEV